MNPWLKRLYDLTPPAVQNALISTFSGHLGKQRYGGRYREFRALLEEAQHWEAGKMRAWQDERLRVVVRHAYDHVPYYRELFDRHGLKPEHIGGAGDLHRIPVLTRDTVKQRIEDLKSRRPGDLAPGHGHTSGTTGSPLSVFYSSDAITMNYAVMDRVYRWAHAQLGDENGKTGDRVAVVRGNVIVPLTQARAPFWRHNRHLNQMLMSSFHLSPANLPAYFEALREFKPAVIDGYPSSLYVLAKTLLNRGETMPLKAAVTSSETLYDFQREAIEKAFQCRVFDYYAAAERVVFSIECDRHEGHHLCEEYGVTEVLDDNDVAVPAGTEGVLVGTSLHNIGMPMIRYRTTDRTALRPQTCSCGRPLPLMEDVTTKAEDLLRLKDGRLIPPSVLTHPFKPLDCIEASQLVQTDLDRLLIRLIPRTDYTEKHGQNLVRDLKTRLGEDMRIDIELVEEMPRTARGKFKWVISQVETGL
jgi:phenylacetate-CoA ligase